MQRLRATFVPRLRMQHGTFLCATHALDARVALC